MRYFSKALLGGLLCLFGGLGAGSAFMQIRHFAFEQQRHMLAVPMILFLLCTGVALIGVILVCDWIAEDD